MTLRNKPMEWPLPGSLSYLNKTKRRSTLAISISAILTCGFMNITLAEGSELTIPSTIEAENYDLGGEGVGSHDLDSVNHGGQLRWEGVDIESANGGLNIGWVESGEWLNYTVNVPVEGNYDIAASVASLNSGGAFHFEVIGDSTSVSNNVTFGPTGGWHNWVSTSKGRLALKAGLQTIRLFVDSGGFNIDSITINESIDLVRGPYSGNRISIPGTIPAENYDLGGSGVAYYDNSTGNAFGHYRSDDVDIEAGLDGEQHIGSVEPGEWLEYSINVLETGEYDLSALIASNDSGGSLHFEVDGEASSTTSFSNTGSWSNWAETSNTTLELSAGEHILRVVIESGVFNINSITIKEHVDVVRGPFTGTATPIPGNIQAENYDLGGSNVAYFDTSQGNTGGAYRTDNVDIEAGLSGEQHIGWTKPGEWLEYTINVERAAKYSVSARIASETEQGDLSLEIAGTSAALNFTGTGGWQNWKDTDSVTLDLPQGEHVLRVLVNIGDFNLDSFTFVEEIDSDGDGVNDGVDAFPFDATEWLDTDGDGLGNNEDTDDDGDEYLDVNDQFPLDASESQDNDFDGIGDNADLDDDNDGVLDVDDAFPLNAQRWDVDSDGDGYDDSKDDFPADSTEWLDTDIDGIGNNTDLDDDADGVLDVDDAFPLDPTRWEPVAPAKDSVSIFDETGLANGFTWRFWQWDIEKHSVTDPDGSEYTGTGPAMFNMGPGHSIPFEQDDKTMSEVDASATEAFHITYSSEEPFEILILWGGPVAGWIESGYPYWTATTYLEGGFFQVNVPASTEVTEFSMDFTDMPTPVNDYFVSLGEPAAIADLAEVQMLLLKNSGSEETVNVTIHEMRFGEKAPEPVDSDGDGYFDSEDAFPDDSSEWLDTDGDKIGNNLDDNDDNDSCLDVDGSLPPRRNTL